MNAELRTTLYGQKQLDCVMDAMAATIASKLIGVERVSLVGVLRRGAPLADQLIERIDLSIKRYADDLTLLYPQTQLTEKPEHASIDLSGRTVVIVDDVLYGGFSLFRAVQYLLTKGVKKVLTVYIGRPGLRCFAHSC